MLNTNNELFENIDLSNLPSLDTNSIEIINILKNYNLENDEKLLNTIENKYHAVTNLITSFYLSKEEVPTDIKKLIKNDYNYRVYLLKFLKQKMGILIEESSAFLFKEVLIILDLLSNGERYYILTNDNMISIENLKILLDDYEKEICEVFLKKDGDLFYLNFQFYLALIDLLNEICIIMSLDIQRKKIIPSILNLITKSVSNLKNKINMDNEYIKQLELLLGRQLIYFTNNIYITIEKKDKEAIVQKYLFMLNRIIHGFELLNKDKKYYALYLDRITTLILTLLYKLQDKLHIKDGLIKNSKYLKEVYSIYNNNVSEEHKVDCENIDQFRNFLLQNFIFIYKNKIEKVGVKNSTELLDYLITLDKVSTSHFKIINNLILYSKKIGENRLNKIIKFILDKEKVNNNYFEFYKLKIIDRIIQKYISLKIEASKNIYLIEIIKYIQKNDFLSDLISIHSKIYLSLSLYYSYENILESQEKSKKFYFIYERLNSNNLENEFVSIRNQIFSNLIKNYFSNKVKTKIEYTDDEMVILGKDLIENYIKYENVKIDNQINFLSNKLIEEILQMKRPNDSWLFKELEELITNKIFFKLAKGKITKSINTKYEIKEVGYEFEILNLHKEYNLRLYYPTYNKKAFNFIYKNNIKLIKTISTNIFKSYLNSIPSYTDTTTKLPNIKKLSSKLEEYKDDKIIFFEIYLDTLVEFSESNNIDISNKLFRLIAKTIDEKVDTYRLFGPKLGFIIDKNKDYKEFIDYLQTLVITFNQQEIKLKSTIGVSLGEANKILEKSFFALSSAKVSKNRVFIYQ